MYKMTHSLRILLILILLITISGCSSLSEMIDPLEMESLSVVTREKPNLTSESAKIDVDPDSDDLVEDKYQAPNSTADDSTNNQANENTSTEDNQPNEESSATAIVATHHSFGKVKIGMTISQASQAFGVELVAPDGDGECYFVEPKAGFKGVEFMVIDGVIARIDIANKDFSTDKGAKIGDSEEKIKSLYQGIEVHPQKYDEKLHDMEIYSDDKKYLIIFETDRKVVKSFRIGRAEEVNWVERCG